MLCMLLTHMIHSDHHGGITTIHTFGIVGTRIICICLMFQCIFIVFFFWKTFIFEPGDDHNSEQNSWNKLIIHYAIKADLGLCRAENFPARVGPKNFPKKSARARPGQNLLFKKSARAETGRKNYGPGQKGPNFFW